MERPWYIKQWEESYQRAIQTTFYDKDAEEFCKDFVPLYLKHAGTKALLKDIREYVSAHTITRKDDIRLQLICMWCDHIHYYRELHGIEFEPEDIFSIKIPKEILSIQ